jgi:16S rRNA A1518/A1519 N6-dimethyltransferase RsmA/KsgA/DIM1 with predicted DNA glycosylase/AP lyase activity
MPYSYGEFKNEVRNHIVDNFGKQTKILDVGAGSGTYGRLLKPHYDVVDAIEIFPDYIKNFNLESVYNKVIIGNILDFDFSSYDYIIMGDVLEHITVNEAQLLIKKMHESDKNILVAVPYKFEQGEEYGNIYETHHQPDLTVAVMYQRYQMLRLIYGDSRYGYFINYIPPIK